ncbi:MAG: protein serine/threonine phosphatase [Paenibacillaceae bacterium]|nr:protein serine/threonine phosphatase [Paenibacillaceae bacterium]
MTAQRTDIGRIRTVNEDRYSVLNDLGGYTLAVIADGMGGHQAGDTASYLAVDTIVRQLKVLHDGMTFEECKYHVKKAILLANERVFEMSSERAHYRGMGTTIVVALASPDYVTIGHIGDSRAYMIRKSKIKQLTEDHSLVSELVRSGQITVEEASNHPRRNVLTRALGTEAAIEVEMNDFEWTKDDLLLLCTDGLSNLLDDPTMLKLIEEDGDLHSKVNRLVDTALVAGGDDNITAVLLANKDSDASQRSEGA